MKRFLIIAFLLLYFCTGSVRAIYESQAGVFDWHHTWIGKPRWVAHHQHATSSHVIIATERNVLASLDSSTGSIDWRQLMEHEFQEPRLTTEGIVTVSKFHPKIQYWDIKSGKLVWERQLETTQTSGILLSDDQQTMIISGHDKVYKLAIKDGATIWEWEHLTASGSHLTLQQTEQEVVYLVETPDHDNIITSSSSSCFVSGLDQVTGQLVYDTARISCQPESPIIIHGTTLLWIEKETLKWNKFGTKKVHYTSLKTLFGGSSPFASTVDKAYSLTTTQDATSEDVFFIQAYAIEDGPDALSIVGVVSLSADGKSVQAVKDMGIQKSLGTVTKMNGQTTRISTTSSLLTMETFNDYNMKEFEFVDHQGDIVLSLSINDTVLLSTSSGSVYMYNTTMKQVIWSREEALAHTTSAVFLDLPEKQTWTLVDEEEVQQQQHDSPLTRYVRRLGTHAIALRKLPSWLIHHFIDMGKPMISSSSIAGDVTTLQAQQCWNNNNNNDPLYRDNFGMRKLLISVTSTGKVVAQDSGRHGKILWTRYVQGVNFTQIHVVRTAAVKMPPVIVVIGTSHTETHLYRLDGLTGHNYKTTSTKSDVQEAFDPELVTPTLVSKVMMLPLEEPDEHTHLLALYDAGTTRVYLYPGTEAGRLVAQPFWSQFYFHYRSTHDGILKGYQVVEGYRHSLTAHPVWNLALPAGEQWLTMAGGDQHQVASLGRVLGNRNVLYKYLNPNMFTVLSGDAERNTLTVHVIDAVKGTILYQATHPHVSSFNVHLVQVENWVVYHFWSNDGNDTGYQVVVLELYEGELENQRVSSSNFSSFDPLQPSIQSAAFAFPYGVRAMGVTSTRNGVSTRDILFALPSHQILTVNKRLLDPRRPTHPPTKDDQEEQLIPYAPIPEERKMFLTYHLEVIGIEHIISAPALLESTSLVYAYGLDTYFTRDSPSRQFDVLSEDFSKSQLLLTIIALVIGILMVGPIVRRKQVNALWQ
ncbi:uncharacterized protein BX664DRAFT_287861 [Halteromyces radiatus]|uniref:uncharacterized protein n=1 Tax=Halteromyces radiatus TaxID=101107 RepID=UPI00221FE7A4|nr:uncharacterized protein BX664DRAFT_287861 [Halteromyces radiatus]KAI8076339.1 hypothetical protein BX664DRAFT_287861 [Halteromyces radiatus]